MKLASFTMFRNEAPILGAFLDQLGEFFDYKIFVNHESSDASPDIVRNRQLPGTDLFHLKSFGYPQSQLATYFTHRIFENTDADWLFFLDCDEFLPFRSRDELIAAIRGKSVGHDALRLHWRNLLPRRLDGNDIFAEGFLTLAGTSNFQKIILSRQLVERAPNLTVLQGYHAATAPGVTVSQADLSDAGLLHIPIQSRYRFAAKIKAAGQKLIDEATLISRGLGYHWVSYHLQFQQQGFANFDFEKTALHYPGTNDRNPEKPTESEFKFDYVKTPYKENFDDLFTQLYREERSENTAAFLLYDDKGNLLQSASNDRPETPAPAVSAGPTSIVPASFEINRLGVGEFYSDVIEPLFSLPIKMPMTAWSGHIPFLFVLFRLMRPRSFVELGVHYGASLIAAATAARAYQIPSRLYGVDSWEGDAHAEFYEGESIYQELASFTQHHFTNVQLIRSYFDEANTRFAPGSIDLLHIDGLHTYDAVKHDFLTWLPKMSPSGVIIFHDTTVRERGFGVYRLWAELEKHFTTLQFFHSFGLGVLFLDGTAEALQPLIRVVRNEDFASFYQSLVADIGALIAVRMRYVEDPSGGGEVQRLNTENRKLEDEIQSLRAESAAYKAEARSLGLLGVRRLLGQVRKR